MKQVKVIRLTTLFAENDGWYEDLWVHEDCAEVVLARALELGLNAEMSRDKGVGYNDLEGGLAYVERRAAENNDPAAMAKSKVLWENATKGTTH